MSNPALDSVGFSVGQLLLVAAIACRQRNQEGLRAVISQIAASCSDKDATELFKTLQQDLSSDLQSWFQDAIQEIRRSY